MKIDGYDESRKPTDLHRIKWALNRGYYISPAILAALLRSGDELTPEIREYVAGTLDGTIKRPRGQPRGFKEVPEKESTIYELIDQVIEKIEGRPKRVVYAIWYMERLRRVRKARGWANDPDDAIRTAAERYGLAYDYLRNHWRRGSTK